MLRTQVAGFVLLTALVIGGASGDTAKKLPQNVFAPFLAKTGKQESVLAQPEIRQSGIFFGSKGIDVSTDGSLKLFTEGKELARIYFNINTPARHWMTADGKPFEKKVLKADLDKQTFIYSAQFPFDTGGAIGDYQHQVQLLPDGKVLLDLSYSVPGERAAEEKIEDQLFLVIPFVFCESQTIGVDGKNYIFSSGAQVSDKRQIFSGKAEKFVFAPGNLKTSFSLYFPEGANLIIRENCSGDSAPHVSMRVRLNGSGGLKALIDLREIEEGMLSHSDDYFAGVDFWKSDRLHVPAYSRSRNVIPNPSFEAGLRYYQYNPVGRYRETKYESIYQCDTSEAYAGNSSLLIHALKIDDPLFPASIGTFAIPVEAGKKYTVSCYVKGNRQNGLTLQFSSVSGQWPVFPLSASFKVGREWKRCHASFVAPNNAICVYLKGLYGGDHPSGEGQIWVDGLQLEEGDLSEYIERPISAELITTKAGNFLTVDEPVNAVLNITSVPDDSGAVHLRLEDFHYRTLWENRYDFACDHTGKARIELPFDSVLQDKPGIFILEAELRSNTGESKRDFFRVTRMHPLNGTHLNKNIFASTLNCFRVPKCMTMLSRLRTMGIGASGISEGESARNHEILRNYGITPMLGSIARHRVTGLQIRGNLQQRHLIEPLEEGIKEVTPELLKIVEEGSFRKVELFPDIHEWIWDGEPDQPHKYQGIAWKKIVEVFNASRKGVKRANPDALFVMGGPMNMMPRAGTAWLNQFLAAGGSEIVDAVSIHPYRTRPEAPDLDDDAAAFFDMLNENGLDDAGVYWNEGILHPHYILPAYALNAHSGSGTGATHWRAGSFSYHMGWGERMQAAYVARSFLVALKYRDRVRYYRSWMGSEWFNDVDLTVRACSKVPNTLGRLLGNAVFRKDIRFAPQVRCYVFEDDQQRPVAAIWSHMPKVDYGEQEPSSAVVPLIASGDYEFFDLMEAEFAPVMGDDGCEISVSSFPVFVRGKPQKLDEMCESLNKARLTGEDFSPVDVSAKPVSDSMLEITVRNKLTRQFKGRLDLGNENERVSKEINLTEREVLKIEVPMAYRLFADRITSLEIPATVVEQNGNSSENNVSFNGFLVRKRKSGPITADGSLDDWGDAPQIAITNRNIPSNLYAAEQKRFYPGDFAASFQMLWDEDNLYLAVRITDDLFVCEPGRSFSGMWGNDSLQVYIDTQADARSRQTRGYDQNDYNYDFFPPPNEEKFQSSQFDDLQYGQAMEIWNKGEAVPFRRYAPHIQLTGGLDPLLPERIEPGVKAAFKKTADGYVYEIIFPRRYIIPATLKQNEIAGFALFLHDKDEYSDEGSKQSKVKSQLTLTPGGTGAHMNPHLWPLIFLAE